MVSHCRRDYEIFESLTWHAKPSNVSQRHSTQSIVYLQYYIPFCTLHNHPVWQRCSTQNNSPTNIVSYSPAFINPPPRPTPSSTSTHTTPQSQVPLFFLCAFFRQKNNRVSLLFPLHSCRDSPRTVLNSLSRLPFILTYLGHVTNITSISSMFTVQWLYSQ